MILTCRTIYVDGFKSTDVGQLVEDRLVVTLLFLLVLQIENAQEAFDEYGHLNLFDSLCSLTFRECREGSKCESCQTFQDQTG